jgi:hypothetical protein
VRIHFATRLLAAVAVFALVAGCSQHDDPAAPLELIDPPTPSNLSIVNNGDGTYDITWDISNESVVKNYRVYSFLTGQPALEGEPTDRMWEAFTLIPISDLPYGVSAVTTENVEGPIAVVLTP